MSMSPRLLRPRSGYIAPDADARAYISSVESADGQKLEAAVARAVNDFVAGCKTDGIWAAIKASCILMGARTLTGALKPLVGTAPTSVNLVSADYNRKTGIVGDGSTKYINTNRATDAESQNSVHLAIYKTTSTSGTNPYFIGVRDSTTSYTVVGQNGIYVRSSATVAPGAGSNSSIGLHAAARSSSDACSSKRPGASVLAATESSVAITRSDTFYVLAYNDLGNPTALSASRFAFYSIGQNLDLALLDTRVSALYTAIGAAI